MKHCIIIGLLFITYTANCQIYNEAYILRERSFVESIQNANDKIFMNERSTTENPNYTTYITKDMQGHYGYYFRNGYCIGFTYMSASLGQLDIYYLDNNFHRDKNGSAWYDLDAVVYHNMVKKVTKWTLKYVNRDGVLYVTYYGEPWPYSDINKDE